MQILYINKYLYPKGGDAISTITTGYLLQSKGHDVEFWGMKHPANQEKKYNSFFIENVDFNKNNSLKEQLKMAANLLYSLEAKNKIKKLLTIYKPNIVHLNNFAHQISPSILHVFKKFRIPVVMTMRDYKMVCPAYSMLKNGKICEACNQRKYYHCFNNKCVKNSRIKSLLNTIEMYLHHRVLHIYDSINVYISPSMFLKKKVIEMGLDGRIEYLPNFVDVKNFFPQFNSSEDSIAYIGRLSNEKGLFTLLKAMHGIETSLKIIGDGPLMEPLKKEAKERGLKSVKFLGFLKNEELHEEIKKSKFIILPSECYENNPRSIIESFALGKPALGARIGGIPELICDNQTGLTFEAGNSEDLNRKLKQLLSDSNRLIQMGRNARKKVEEELNAEIHYKKLIDIYHSVLN